jgi:GrpB-like predicted nucleotidyltransferase (UPF0157 family)
VITVVPYDPSWAGRFDQLRTVLDDALDAAEVPFRSIEHVGSTSVPGLAAKPIIDCDIVVAPDQVAAASAVVAGLGFEARGDLGIPLRYAFEGPQQWQDVHLYVVVGGSIALRNHLAVRDVLRADPDLRDRYAALKAELATATDDIDEYTSAKGHVLQDVLAAAGLPAEELAAIEEVNRLADRPTTRAVLLTGMSGTGKSTIVAMLRDRGVTAVDTDDGYVDVLPDGTQRWRVDAVRDLLARPRTSPLVVAGCEENMVELLDAFDRVVLLSVPRDVLVDRLTGRRTNPFGTRPGELERVLADLDAVEPRLRALCDVEIVTDAPPDQTVAALLALL